MSLSRQYRQAKPPCQRAAVFLLAVNAQLTAFAVIADAQIDGYGGLHKKDAISSLRADEHDVQGHGAQSAQCPGRNSREGLLTGSNERQEGLHGRPAPSSKDTGAVPYAARLWSKGPLLFWPGANEEIRWSGARSGARDLCYHLPEAGQQGRSRTVPQGAWEDPRVPAVSEIIAVLEQAYPPALAESWDAVGLVCGDPAEPTSKVLFCVDPVAETVDEAEESGARLIVAHHPLLLRGVHGVPADTTKGALVHRMIRSGIALYCAHTNADSADPGVSDALAEAIGLRVLRPLDPKPEANTGLGRIGELPEPEKFAKYVERVAHAPPTTRPDGLGD